jgi:dihydrofolate synthase / folylpolyglutamate synthase
MTRAARPVVCGPVSDSVKEQEKAALDWLYGTQLFGVKLGLETTRKLLGVLGLPGPGQKFFHVAGTNGKGSVCALLHSLLNAAGVNAGLFTSPHLVHFRERIRDAERMISAGELVKGLESIRKIGGAWTPHPTFFEITFALGMDWFRKRKREWVVLETGMGGRLDATNAVTPQVCIITSIGLDHQSSLGSTLAEIANEKAGIIKPSVPVITLKQSPEVMQVLSAVARERGAPLTIITNPMRGHKVSLAGQHQLWNAALAVAALKAAGFNPTDAVLRKGLGEAEWPARFQRLNEERLVIDGAHNPAAADALTRTWMQTYPGEKASVIFGGVADKDLRGVMHALQPIAARWHFTAFNSPRASEPESLRDVVKQLFGAQVETHVHANPQNAIAAAQRDPERLLVTGSLYLAGETLALLREESGLFQASAQ